MSIVELTAVDDEFATSQGLILVAPSLRTEADRDLLFVRFLKHRVLNLRDSLDLNLADVQIDLHGTIVLLGLDGRHEVLFVKLRI